MQTATHSSVKTASRKSGACELPRGSSLSFRRISFRILILLGYLLFSEAVLAGNIYYVKTMGDDTKDGKSWGMAFKTLQNALATAVSGDQIWVAAGTYKPTADTLGNTNPDDTRTKSFVMKNEVAIYGGFAGTETQLSLRAWKNNVTILSGNLNGEDQISGSGRTLSISNNSENSYHVIFNNDNSFNNAAGLDGFTIVSGNANGSGDPNI